MISIVRKSPDLLTLRFDRAECLVATGDFPTRKAQSDAVAALIAGHFGHEVSVLHDADGAPFLPEGYPFISISHCHGAVAVAFSAGPIGIDVETWRDRLLRVAPRFLTVDEREAVGDNPVALLRAWTFKEAAFKMLHSSAQPPSTITQIPLRLPGSRSLTLHLPEASVSLVVPSEN